MDEMETMPPLVLKQGEVPWDTCNAEQFTDEADKFECEVAEHICQAGNVQGNVSIDNHPEDCVIVLDEAKELAQASVCPVKLDFINKPVKAVTDTLHLHKALPVKVDYDRIFKYFLYFPTEVIQKAFTQLTKAQINYPLKQHIWSPF